MHKLKITLVSAAAVVALISVAVVAYDRSRSSAEAQNVRYDLRITSPAVDRDTFNSDVQLRVKLGLWPTFTVGPNHKGCWPVTARTTACDLAIAFPDVGLTGRAVFDSGR